MVRRIAVLATARTSWSLNTLQEQTIISSWFQDALRWRGLSIVVVLAPSSFTIQLFRHSQYNVSNDQAPQIRNTLDTARQVRRAAIRDESRSCLNMVMAPDKKPGVAGPSEIT